MTIKKFFEEYKDIITGIVAITGLLVAIAGFSMTIQRINMAATQIQAANEYNMRRDLRSLIQELDESYIQQACFTATPTCSEEDFSKTSFGLGLLFNFFSSVYSQSQAHGISERFKKDMMEDFCFWFTLKPVSDFWEKRVNEGLYNKERIAMKKKWCKGDN